MTQTIALKQILKNNYDYDISCALVAKKNKGLAKYFTDEFKVIQFDGFEQLERAITHQFNPEPEEPKQLLSVFNFQIVGVNAKGEQIKKESKQSQYFSEDLGNGITLEMLAIPGGTFLMGSPQDEKDSFGDERPQHEVNVPPFFIGKYPITQEQWRAIASRTDLKVDPSAPLRVNLDLNPAYFKDRPDSDRRPVEQVNWYDAIEFCARLSKLTGGEYRLPSEAEWEYACRAGTTTPFYFALAR